MRAHVRSLALAAALALIAPAAPALAAPTCQTRDGGTIRCGTPGAMPVGWRLPDALRAPSPLPPPAVLAGLACVVGGLFALIALMPDFQSREGDGWDGEAG